MFILPLGDVPAMDVVTTSGNDDPETGSETDVPSEGDAAVLDAGALGIWSSEKVNCVEVVTLKFTFILPNLRLLHLNKISYMYVAANPVSRACIWN